MLTTYATDATSAARLLRAPSGDHSGAFEALDLARHCGLSLLPWQEATLQIALAERDDGRWSCGEMGLIVPRQNGKTHLLAARIIAGLLLFDEKLLIYTAHRFKLALELFRLVDGALRSTNDTARQIVDTTWGHGEETIEMRSRARFKILARTKASGRGYGSDCLMLDEALELRDEAPMAALMPVLSARDNPQVWYSSSAGDAGSVVLAGVRERARKGDDDALGFVEYSAPPETPADDRDAWRDANPAYGSLIRPEAIEREYRAMKDSALDEFRQERMGVWPLDAARAVIPSNAWEAARKPTTEAPGIGDFALAFDVAPDRTHGAIIAAWRRLNGVMHVRVTNYDSGDAWLVDRLRALHAAYLVPIGYDDSGPARDIGDALARSGVPVLPWHRRDFVTACARFLSGVVNGAVTHNGDAALDRAAAGAGTQRVGEAWAFSRRGKVDISPLTAATLAIWSLDHSEQVEPLEAPAIF